LATLLYLSVPCQAENNAKTSNNPHVLFLSSYSYQWESNPLMLRGCSETLSDKAIIDYEFMDTKRLDYEDVKDRVYQDIVSFEEDSQFDYVITADDAALHFAVEFQDDLFANTPIIFEGINDVDFAYEAAKNPLITGLIETFPLEETIDLALKINPKATAITVISDDTISGQGSTKQFMACQENHTDLDFNVIDCSKLTASELSRTVENCDKDTILIYLMMTTDKDGNHYTHNEAIHYLTESADVPIYKADELGMGEGIIGGVVISYYDMAAQAANIVLSIAQGAEISQFPIINTTTYCEFDMNVMKKFGITKTTVLSSYDGEIKFINENKTYFEEHQSALIPAGIIICLLIAILIIFITSVKKNRKIMHEMVDRDRMLDNLLKNMPGGMIIYKFMRPSFKTAKIAYFSKGIPKLSNRTDEEFKTWMGKDAFANLKEEVDHSEILQTVYENVQKRKPISLSYHRKDRNGRRMMISLAATWSYDDANGNRVYYAVFMDETLQDQVLAAEKEAFLAKASDTAKSEFLSNMSHDIRTPISTIIGITDLAESETDDPTAMKKDIVDIHETSQYLLGIVNDILDMSRIESGKYTLNYKWARIAEVMHSCINIVKPDMEKKKIHFIYPDMSNYENIEYYIDVLKTQRMLVNILNNACKFTGEGGTVSLTIRNLKHNDTNATDLITIEDNGCGMSEEFLKTIFTPFAQENNPYSDQQPGTGLGLVLARQNARAMGGDITVESKLGQGTKFMITYQYRYRDADQNTEKEPAINQYDANVLNGKRILVCEDSSIIAEIEKKQLEAKKCIVDIAADGRMAVNMFLKSRPAYYDAILMDIRMPVMNGLEAAQHIREAERSDAKDVPIIAMSANAYQEDIDKSINAGMNAHLAKPVDTSLMFATLVKHIMDRENKGVSNNS
jgi:signal transduction histidine kinase/ActR/RegA family two-component response regulator